MLRLITPWSPVPSRMLDYWQAYFWLFEAILEKANSFAQPLTKLGKFFRPEYKQRDTENYKQMHWLKQTVKHNLYPMSNGDLMIKQLGKARSLLGLVVE